MRNNPVRNMYMHNNPPCPWMGQYHPHGGNGPVPMNGPPPFPGPAQGHFPYHMMPPPPPNWQPNYHEPGPSRPRGRGFRTGRGTGNRGNHRNLRRTEQADIKDMCCKCGERLQNSNEPGIHLCDGGSQVIVLPEEPKVDPAEKTDDNTTEEELNVRLEKLLENLMRNFVGNKYNSVPVTEALEGYLSDQIGEINTLHKQNSEEKVALEKVKAELVEKANSLIKQEQELKDRQKRLAKDQDSFKREMKKEREEVCRKWQELRDEITRMEEMHDIQKGRVKLDVGGHMYTTSILTLTRESDSMLAAMFSGRHELLKEDDGCVFIDRDGTHFRYVLNYLRDGGVNMECLPRDRQLLRELKKEATYFQLHGLIQQIEKCIY